MARQVLQVLQDEIRQIRDKLNAEDINPAQLQLDQDDLFTKK